jgi:hypothetical protein
MYPALHVCVHSAASVVNPSQLVEKPAPLGTVLEQSPAVQVSCPVVASPAAASAAHAIVAGTPAYPASHSTPQLAPATSDTPSPQPPLSAALTPAPKA